MKNIADIINDNAVLVQGFKVFGMKIPFSTKPLRTDTVIELAGISSSIIREDDGSYDIVKNLPLLINYIAVGLNNKRCKFLLVLIRRYLYTLQQPEIEYLYRQVQQLWNPSLFFCLLEETKLQEKLLITETEIEANTNSVEEKASGEESPL